MIKDYIPVLRNPIKMYKELKANHKAIQAVPEVKRLLDRNFKLVFGFIIYMVTPMLLFIAFYELVLR